MLMIIHILVWNYIKAFSHIQTLVFVKKIYYCIIHQIAIYDWLVIIQPYHSEVNKWVYNSLLNLKCILYMISYYFNPILNGKKLNREYTWVIFLTFIVVSRDTSSLVISNNLYNCKLLEH